MKKSKKNTIIAITVIIILVLIVGVTLINNTSILEKIGKNRERMLETEATSKLEQALEIAKTRKENDENYNNEEYLSNLLKEQNISIYENIAIVNEYNFEIDKENLIITQSLGKTNVTIETKVLKLLGQNDNGKERAKIKITVSSNTPIENIIFENENGTYNKEKTEELTYAKQLELELDKDYVITVATKDGKLSSKILKNTKEDYTPPKIETPSIGDGTIREGNELPFTWEQLSEIADIISNTPIITNDTNEFTLNYDGNDYIIGVGDYTTVKYNGEDLKVRIMGFNHDILSEQGFLDSEGNVKEEYIDTSSSDNQLSEVAYNNLKKAGISFEFVDFLANKSAMNSSATNSGGWADCDMRKITLPEIFTTFPENVKKNIKKVTKVCQIKYNDTPVSYTDDYLWLLSCEEIYGSTVYGNEGRRYKYHKNNANECIQKPTSNYAYWWLRSLNVPYSNGFCAVHNTKRTIVQAYATAEYGVAPGFSI